jgi:hypothetical protein
LNKLRCSKIDAAKVCPGSPVRRAGPDFLLVANTRRNAWKFQNRLARASLTRPNIADQSAGARRGSANRACTRRPASDTAGRVVAHRVQQLLGDRKFAGIAHAAAQAGDDRTRRRAMIHHARPTPPSATHVSCWTSAGPRCPAVLYRRSVPVSAQDLGFMDLIYGQ